MTAGLPMRGEGVEQTCPMSIVKSYMTYIFFSFFFAIPHGLWDLRLLTSDQTHAIGRESTGS